MTRRIVKSNHESGIVQVSRSKQTGQVTGITSLDWDERPVNDCTNDIKAKYKVGDVLWVRETWCHDHGDGIGGDCIYYKADNIPIWEGHWKPSIFMPKSACRLFLEVTNIDIERLQIISENDAKAEGVETKPYGSYPFFCTIDYIGTEIYKKSKHVENRGFKPGFCADTGSQYRDSFQTLWSVTYGPDSWSQNPFVWVITFKKIERPEGFK